MKLLIVTMLILSHSIAFDRPPSPPTIWKISEKKIVDLSAKKISKQPVECKLLPQMFINIPTPMEEMLTLCKNELLKPTLQNSKNNIKKLFGEDVEVDYIKTVKEFNNLYEIRINNRFYLCNKTIDTCFKKTKFIR